MVHVDLTTFSNLYLGHNHLCQNGDKTLQGT